MTLGERVRYIREDLNLSRASFGETLGISGDVVNNLERDRNKTNNAALLRLICKTYNVNYFWLTEEIGNDPYVSPPGIITNEAVEKYHLDEMDKKIIEEYVKLNPQSRQIFKNYLSGILRKTPD